MSWWTKLSCYLGHSRRCCIVLCGWRIHFTALASQTTFKSTISSTTLYPGIQTESKQIHNRHRNNPVHPNNFIIPFLTVATFLIMSHVSTTSTMIIRWDILMKVQLELHRCFSLTLCDYTSSHGVFPLVLIWQVPASTAGYFSPVWVGQFT